jgi:S-DNA-T family DNA segregation ATPase FtsK/SpoIIIE
MEEMGIVGPFVGSKPRQILVTKEQWEQMKQGQTIVIQPDPPSPAPAPGEEEAEEDVDIPF